MSAPVGCYVGCTPPVIHVPTTTIPSVAPHLAYTGMNLIPFLILGVAAVVTGGLSLWLDRKKS